MIKVFFREFFILLLLCACIILILGAIFYDYIPTSKVVPSKEAYTVPENIKKELAETAENAENVMTIVTYEIDNIDLNNYQKTNNYKPGKVNPFAAYQPPSDDTDNTSNNSTITNNNGTATNTDNTITSGGNFFQEGK